MDYPENGNPEYLLSRIKEQEVYIAFYQKRLKENLGDFAAAEVLMTLQVSLENLKNEYESLL